MLKLFKWALCLFALINIQLGNTQSCFTGGGNPDLSYFDVSNHADCDVYVPIRFSIVRSTAGTGGIDPEKIDDLKSVLDDGFNQYGIYFEYFCGINFIDDSNATSASSYAPEFVCRWKEVDEYGNNVYGLKDDAINIVIHRGSGGTSGLVDNIPGTLILYNTKNSEIGSSNVIVHEMGHALGLYHMYRGCWESQYIIDVYDHLSGEGAGYNCESNPPNIITDSEACAENSFNGTVCGDLIFHTPPSHIYAETEIILDSDCNWEAGESLVIHDPDGKPFQNGTVPLLDPDGNYFNPDMTNYMCRTPNKKCRDHFTNDQVAVMKNHIGCSGTQHPIFANFEGSNPVDPICDCPNREVIQVTEPTLWSDLMAENFIYENNLDDLDILVDNQLTIDVPFTFNNCLFTNSTNGKLIVSSDSIAFNSCTLTACTDSWKGIEQLENSELVIDSCIVEKAIIGIKNHNNGSTIDITHSKFINNETALSFTADPKLSDFYDNHFLKNELSTFDHTYGIKINATPNYIDISGTEEMPNIFEKLQFGVWSVSGKVKCGHNVFNDIEQVAISLKQSVGAIVNTQFNNCKAGIKGSTATYTCSKSYFRVSDYAMGDLYGYCVAIDNTIFSDRYGIKALSAGLYANDNDIYVVNDDTSLEAVAILADNSDYCSITNNWISFSEGKAGILLNECNRANATENTIYLTRGWDTYGVQVEGGAANNISCNDIEVYIANDPEESFGIAIEGSNANTLTCNELDNLEEAIHIEGNSAVQTILSNTIGDAGVGLHTESFLGPQPWHGNKWVGQQYEKGAWSDGPSSDDNFNMQFKVDESEGSEYMPPLVDPEGEWFIPKPGNNQDCGEEINSCSGGSAGYDYSSPADEMEHICNHLQNQPTKTCNDAWLNDFALFKQYKAYVAKGGEMTPCLKTFFTNTDTTAMSIFYAIDQTLSAMDSVSQAQQIQLADAVSSELDNGGDISGYMQTLHDLNAQLDSIRTTNIKELSDDLTTIKDTCTIVQDWKTTYTISVDTYLNGGDQGGRALDRRTQQRLEPIALQCASRGGEAVYRARRLLTRATGIRYDLLEQCDGNNVINPRSIDTTVDDAFAIVPNPATDAITIAFAAMGDRSVTITDLAGNAIYTTSTYESSLSVPLDHYAAGVYIVNVTHHSSGHKSVQKLIVH